MHSKLIRRSGWLVGGMAAVAVFGASVGGDLSSVWAARSGAAGTLSPALPLSASHSVVAARGRLQPTGGVIRVAGPNQPGAVVGRLAVREGDWVDAGAVVAVLDGTAAQRAAVQRLTAEAVHAATDRRRILQLFRDGIVSTAERDAAQLRTDVAGAELARARAVLDASSVRAPFAGRVLTIHTHQGERIGAEGVLDLGDTAHMEVVAEVYETDVAHVYPGQPVAVSAAALPLPLSGEVERIGLTVGKQSVFDIDPTSDADARVVEVHIRLDDAAHAATLTNLQVDVDLG